MDTYRCLIIAALLAFPLLSSAQELRLGVDAQGAYDSNVFATSIEEVDDFSFRVAPDVLLEDHEGELQWDLRYKPSYEYFIDTVPARGWDHQAWGGFSYQINPTTRVEVSNRFAHFQSTNRFNEVVTQGAGDEVVDTTREDFRQNRNTRNNAEATLTHNLSPARMLTFRLGYSLVDYRREGTADRDTLSATASYLQTLSRRNQLGGGVSYRRSSRSGTSNRPSQSTDFFNLFANWIYQFDETLQLSLAAGPTLVQGDDRLVRVAPAEDRFRYPLLIVQDNNRLVRASSCPMSGGGLALGLECEVIDEDLPNFIEVDPGPPPVFIVLDPGTPPVPGQMSFLDADVLDQWNPTGDLELIGSVPSGSNESLTYFANMSLSKRWKQWTGTISYRRQQSDTSDLGSSSVADVLNGTLQWRPSPRWSSTLTVAATLQSQASEGIGTVVAVRSADLSTEAAPGLPGLGPAFRDVAESVGIRAVTVDQNLDYLTLWLRLNVRYRLSKRATLYGNFVYLDQSTDSDVVRGRDYDRLRIGFGVEYRFDPIRL